MMDVATALDGEPNDVVVQARILTHLIEALRMNGHVSSFDLFGEVQNARDWIKSPRLLAFYEDAAGHLLKLANSPTR